MAKPAVWVFGKARIRVLASLIGAGFLIGGFGAFNLPAVAGDDGSGSVLDGLMEISGMNPPAKQPDISYLERPPLVLPPSMDLPQPQKSAAGTNPAWPNDPDVARQKLEAQRPGIPKILSLEHYGERSSNRRLQANRLAPGTSKPRVPQTACELNPEGRDCLTANWADLKARPNPAKPDAVIAGQEPVRDDLTDPPPGYRAATKNVKATNDAPVKHDDSPLDFIKQQAKQ